MKNSLLKIFLILTTFNKIYVYTETKKITKTEIHDQLNLSLINSLAIEELRKLILEYVNPEFENEFIELRDLYENHKTDVLQLNNIYRKLTVLKRKLGNIENHNASLFNEINNFCKKINDEIIHLNFADDRIEI